jgi:hypothetical protein
MSAAEDGGGPPGEMSGSHEANVSLWFQIIDAEPALLLGEDEG